MLEMASMDEQMKAVGSGDRAVLMDEMKIMGEDQGKPAAKKVINSELWHACAGPLVSIPQPGSLVYYFPQGHSEQVTASTRKTAYPHIPNYPNLPSQLMCQVHNVTLHADKDSDEIYAQITLQPVNSELDVFPIPDFGHTRSKQPNEFFCKNLTASDTSTHGGFSVPRRAAEKLFPQLDYSMQPPNQELIVRDLHDNVWTFRHIYRGQPKRHLLTTGWSLFVGTKRLKAGDSVLFIRDEKSQLLLGIRRANRQQTTLPSSVLSADSMHMGVLAAAAHAAASLSPFTVYYNPRACSSEFMVPLGKYHKAAYAQISIGMRFGMMFETEESTKRRYMGTIVGISDYDPLRWPNSKWRNLQVEWDEHGYGERPERVSIWEIETPESLFIFPTQPSLKRQCLPGFVVPGTGVRFGNMKPLLQPPGNGQNVLHPIISDLGSEQLMKVLYRHQAHNNDSQLEIHQSIYASILHNIRKNDTSTYCFSNSPTLCATRCPTQEEGIITKMVMQQKQHFPHVQQQMLPEQNIVLQNQNHQHCVDQKGINYASWEHMKPSEQMNSHPEHHEQNECNEGRVNLSGSKCGDVQLQEAASEKSDVATVLERNQVDEHLEEKVKAANHQNSECSYQLLLEQSRESSVQLSDHENLLTPYSTTEEAKKKKQDDSELLQQQLLGESTTASLWLETVPQVNKNDVDNLVTHQGYLSSQYLDDDNWSLHSSYYQSFTGHVKSPEYLSSSGKMDSLVLSARDNTASSSAELSSIVNPVETLQYSCISDSQSPQCLPNFIQEFFGAQEVNPLHELVVPSILPFEVHDSQVQKEGPALQDFSNSCGARDLSDDSNNQSESYSNLHFETSNRSTIAGSSASSTVLETLSTVRGSNFYFPSEDLVGNFTSNQDMQSQVTSASLVDNSQVFSVQEIPDSSGGTSSSSVEVNEHGLVMGPMTQASQQPLRTYTKVQKLGSVGRSIDVTRFRNYQELTSAISCMFGLQGQLDDPRASEWKLVYVDYENDVLLVGDDPWEEFVNCVRCIRILSPSEVQLMSEDGMQLMNSYIPPCQ